jgi:hypothetical protein
MEELTREFLIESQEGLDRTERCLADLEENPEDAALIGEIFRRSTPSRAQRDFSDTNASKNFHVSKSPLGLREKERSTPYAAFVRPFGITQ